MDINALASERLVNQMPSSARYVLKGRRPNLAVEPQDQGLYFGKHELFFGRNPIEDQGLTPKGHHIRLGLFFSPVLKQ